MSNLIPSTVNELERYEFVRFIRRRRKAQLIQFLVNDVWLFVPRNEALPLRLRDQTIGLSWWEEVHRLEDQVMRRIDIIHFQSMRGSQICMIGCDIRTEGGFPQERLLFAVRQYALKESEVKLLFGIDQRHPVASCQLVITSGFFVSLPLYSHCAARRRHFSFYTRFPFG